MQLLMLASLRCALKLPVVQSSSALGASGEEVVESGAFGVREMCGACSAYG